MINRVKNKLLILSVIFTCLLAWLFYTPAWAEFRTVPWLASDLSIKWSPVTGKKPYVYSMLSKHGNNESPSILSCRSVHVPQEITDYMRDIKRLILGKLHYKPQDDQRQWVECSIRIKVDGSLASVELSHSSGQEQFDISVLEAVRNTAPFPPPPGSSVFNHPWHSPEEWTAGFGLTFSTSDVTADRI